VSDTLTILQAAALTLDPHVTTDRRANLGIRWAEHAALVRRDAAGAFAPALAASWQVAPGGRSWTFVLRADARFADGTPVDAAAAVASLHRVCDPHRAGELGTTGVIAGYLAGATFAARDARTLTIDLAQPIADLLELLVDIPIVSAGLIGAGPYCVVATAPGEVTMAAVAGHRDGPRRAGTLCWRAVADPAEAARQVRDGAADIAVDLPVALADEAAGWPGCVVRHAPSPTCIAFLLNAAQGVCADRRVRQALNLALDVPAIIRAAGVDATPLNGPLTPLHPACDPSLSPWPHDPAAARALLASAGHSAGLAITVDVPTSLPEEAPTLAREMAAQWAAVGVDATVRVHENREAYALMVRDKRIGDACCFDSSPLSGYRVLREKLHGGVDGPWRQGYANPAVDALLDRAAATADDTEREAIYRDAYRLLHDDAPWAFLYRPRYAWVARADAAWRPDTAGWVIPG
jgi:peptide/nickel transport system substrate-binding protein